MISWTLLDIACFSSASSWSSIFNVDSRTRSAESWGLIQGQRFSPGQKACMFRSFFFPDELMRSFFCRVANHASVAFTPMFQQKTIRRSPKKASRFTGPVAVWKALHTTSSSYRHCPLKHLNLRHRTWMSQTTRAAITWQMQLRVLVAKVSDLGQVHLWAALALMSLMWPSHRFGSVSKLETWSVF